MRGTKNRGLLGVLYEDNWLEMGLNCLGQRPAFKRARSEKASESSQPQEAIRLPKREKKSDECADETPEQGFSKSTRDAKKKVSPAGGIFKKYKGVCLCRRRNKHRAFLTLPKAIFNSLPSPPMRSWSSGALTLGYFPTQDEAAKARDLAILALHVIDEENSRFDLSRAALLHFPDHSYPKESIDLMHQFIYSEGYVGVRSSVWDEHVVHFRGGRLMTCESQREAAMCYDKACLAVFGMNYEGALNFNATAYDEEEVSWMFKSLLEKYGLRRLKSIVRHESEGVMLAGYHEFVPVFRQVFSVPLGVYSTLLSAKRAYDLARLAFSFHNSRKNNYPVTSYSQAEIDDFRCKMEVKYPYEVKALVNTFCRVQPSASSFIDQAFRNVECRSQNRAGCAGDQPTKAASENKVDLEVPESHPELGDRVACDGSSAGGKDREDEWGQDPNVDYFWGGTSQGRSLEGFEYCSVDIVSVPCAKDEPVESAVGMAPRDSVGGGGDLKLGNCSVGAAEQECFSFKCEATSTGVRVKEEHELELGFVHKVEEGSRQV